MFDLDSNGQFLLGLAAASAAKFTALWWLREKRNDRFELVGTISGITMYPAKSCRGVELQEAYCSKYGLESDGIFDRHWMVTRPDGRFLSQRQCSKMALISTVIKSGGIQLTAPGKQPFFVQKWDGVIDKSRVTKCSVWSSKNLEGIDCGDDVAQWLSDFLEMPDLRMVYFSHDLTPRAFVHEQKPWESRAIETDRSGYADWGTYLFLTESSLAALNKELTNKVTMRSFRPNYVIAGTDAFEEDTWEEIRIGEDVQMRCLDACTRCVLTTVDPDKGERSTDGEPLKTLHRIRRIPPYGDHKETAFGINTSPDSCGMIQVGDPVYAIRKH